LACYVTRIKKNKYTIFYSEVTLNGNRSLIGRRRKPREDNIKIVLR